MTKITLKFLLWGFYLLNIKHLLSFLNVQQKNKVTFLCAYEASSYSMFITEIKNNNNEVFKFLTIL